MKVPFLDLLAQYRSIEADAQAALNSVIEKTAFAGGPFVSQFEEEFAAFCDCERAVGVGSGTDALWAALLAMGVGSGDEVITAANTFIATAEAISFAGARPVFVDVEEHSYNMDPAQLSERINNRTRAIIPVHLYGRTADMDPILEIASKHNLVVIEDASQAHGAEYKGRRAGSMGDMGCFSFYPGKNLGAFGEAGAIVTNRTEQAKYAAQFRDHGQAQKYYHDMIGWNARMDGIQGAILSVKLKRLDEWNAIRRRHADLYDELLAPVKDVITPPRTEGYLSVYHIYAIRHPRRDDLMEYLKSKDIYCGIHYPVPLHLQKAYESLALDKGAFPVSEKVAGEIISLPMYAELTEEQIHYVAEMIRSFPTN